MSALTKEMDALEKIKLYHQLNARSLELKIQHLKCLENLKQIEDEQSKVEERIKKINLPKMEG